VLFDQISRLFLQHHVNQEHAAHHHHSQTYLCAV
jgi:hypothetical protein